MLDDTFRSIFVRDQAMLVSESEPGSKLPIPLFNAEENANAGLKGKTGYSAGDKDPEQEKYH